MGGVTPQAADGRHTWPSPHPISGSALSTSDSDRQGQKKWRPPWEGRNVLRPDCSEESKPSGVNRPESIAEEDEAVRDARSCSRWTTDEGRSTAPSTP